MSETDPRDWTAYVQYRWEIPEELRSPTPYIETNLTVMLLTCPALNVDRLAGRFLIAAMAQHDFVVERQSRATTDPWWFAAQYEVGQREQPRILDALHRFRELEGSDLPSAEKRALRDARRREVEVEIEAAITAYENAMSND